MSFFSPSLLRCQGQERPASNPFPFRGVAWIALLTAILQPLAGRADFKFPRDDDILGKATFLEDKALAEAVSQMQANDYTGAVATLKRLATLTPRDEKVWFLLAAAHYRLHQLDEALAAANRCAELKPRWPQGYWLKGIVLTARSNLAEASRAYDRAVEVAPAEPGGYLQRAQFFVLYRSKDLDRLRAAVQDLKRALRLAAPAETAHGLLGLAYRQLGDFEQTEFHLQEVLKRSPNHLDAVRELVSLYDELKQTAKADRLLAEVDAREKLRPVDRAGLSLIAARRAIGAGAAASVVEGHFRAGLSAMPADVAGRLEYARWLEMEERLTEAIGVLHEGLRQTPHDPDIAAHLAWVLAETGQDLDQAWRWLQVARRRHPTNPYLADTQAWIEYRRGSYRAAWDAIGPSLDHVQDAPEIAYHAGAILAKLGDRARAAHFVRKALEPGRRFTGRQDAEALLTALSSKVGSESGDGRSLHSRSGTKLSTAPVFLAFGLVGSVLVAGASAWQWRKRLCRPK